MTGGGSLNPRAGPYPGGRQDDTSSRYLAASGGMVDTRGNGKEQRCRRYQMIGRRVPGLRLRRCWILPGPDRWRTWLTVTGLAALDGAGPNVLLFPEAAPGARMRRGPPIAGPEPA